jgi:biotin carboxyl carrier protein
MKCEMQLLGPDGKKSQAVAVERLADRWIVSVDGRLVGADVAKIAPNIFSIILDGHVHDVRISETSEGLNLQTGAMEFFSQIIDRRAWRGRHSHAEAEGRQQVSAPMPGKVVRLLVKPGDLVKAGQGLVVIEAMKMQNEVRSPKSGKIDELLVAEGQRVNAGQALLSVE